MIMQLLSDDYAYYHAYYAYGSAIVVIFRDVWSGQTCGTASFSQFPFFLHGSAARVTSMGIMVPGGTTSATADPGIVDSAATRRHAETGHPRQRDI